MMADYEAMKAELQANGYSVWASSNPYRKPTHIETPDGFLFYGNPLSLEESQYAEVIEKAWAHYQEKKRYAAMETLLCTMIDEKLYMDMNSDCEPSTQLLGWIRRVEGFLNTFEKP